MLEQVLIVLGTSLATAFSGWVFFIRKHKAEAVGVETNNTRQEIENYKLIAQEWREAAQQWKDLADEYQAKLIENSRKIERLESESAAIKKEVITLKGLLTRAQNRIIELEKHG